MHIPRRYAAGDVSSGRPLSPRLIIVSRAHSAVLTIIHKDYHVIVLLILVSAAYAGDTQLFFSFHSFRPNFDSSINRLEVLLNILSLS